MFKQGKFWLSNVDALVSALAFQSAEDTHSQTQTFKVHYRCAQVRPQGTVYGCCCGCMRVLGASQFK